MAPFFHPRRSPRLEVLEDRLALSTLAVSDVGQREGDLGSRLFEFTVRLSDPGRGPVTVRYETADGTALAADNDYEAGSGTLRFGPGQTSKTVAVRVNGDHLVEGDETFFLRLSDARGAAIADGEGQGTIRNDDPGFLVDDFNAGNDDGWTRVDFTAGVPGGPGSFDASTGAYRLSTAGAVPADDPSVGTVLSTWEGTRGNAAFGNGIVRGKVRANTQGTTAGFLLRASDSPGVEHDYGFFGSSSFGTFYIERFDHVNGQTIIAMADPDRH